MMKKLRCVGLALAAMLASGAVVVGQEKGAPAAKAPATPIEKASYGIGLNIGRGMKSDGLEIDVKFLVQGVMDAIEGKESVLTEAQLREAFQTVQKELQSKQLERSKMAGDKNKKDGEAFLATNKKKQGVTTLESGLQYQVIKSGKGPSPKATDQVRTHYHGTLIDGKVFDSSVDRGEPVTFPVNGVIKGWTEALQLMKVGDKWRVFVPSALAYGERGAGADIGPNAVLVFEIELLGIE